MNVLFIADIHIKIGQKNVPVEWAKNRYGLFCEKVKNLQARADMVILGGDVFDKLPNMEELEIYFDLVRVFDRTTIIIPGNHESVKKNTTFLTNLKAVTKAVNKHVKIIDDFYTLGPIDFIPYNKLKEYHPQDVDFHNDILVTHVRGEIPPHVKPEVPLELFERWKVVLAGDLHSYENSQRNILYPGSPMSTSFHRNPVDTGVILFDTDNFTHEWISLSLPQLLRKTVRAGEQMTAGTYDHVVYEVEGDLTELAQVETTGLVDRKVTKRDHDVALMLSQDMTLAQELSEYLQFILGINEESVLEILQEFAQLENKISD
jgi:DNA repair exonuclease SbcCD nuclease subunit